MYISVGGDMLYIGVTHEETLVLVCVDDVWIVAVCVIQEAHIVGVPPWPTCNR